MAVCRIALSAVVGDDGEGGEGSFENTLGISRFFLITERQHLEGIGDGFLLGKQSHHCCPSNSFVSSTSLGRPKRCTCARRIDGDTMSL